MKVILYMAITANGIIAKDDDTADFLTKEESASYVSMVISTGNLIIGRRTYEVLSMQPEFREFLKAGIKIIVVSHSDFSVKDTGHLVAHSPQKALAFVASDAVVVAGGAMLNAAFLGENLVDEVYLDVEPAFLGKGMPLFSGKDFERRLELLGIKNISKNEIQLHYKVVH